MGKLTTEQDIINETMKFLASVGLTLDDLRAAEIKSAPLKTVEEVEEIGERHEPVDMLKFRHIKLDEDGNGIDPTKQIEATPRIQIIDDDDKPENKLILKTDILTLANSDN